MREELKLKQSQIQLNVFHNELKSFVPMPTFFPDSSSVVEGRVKDK